MKMEVSESGKALGEKMRRWLSVALWSNRRDRKTAQAVERVAGYVCHRIEFPRLRKLGPDQVDSARVRIRAGKGWRKSVVTDKQRLGFTERKLSTWDFEEIRGAVSVVLSERDGFSRALVLEDWKALFRASRAALSMDRKDGPGAKGRTVSIQALEDLTQTDFHSGLCAGKSACDLETAYSVSATDYLATREAETEADSATEKARRIHFADMARDFRNALRFALHASIRGRKQARRDWKFHLATLRLATRAISGAGHGMDSKRKDRKPARGLHARIGRFSAYVSQGFLAEACHEIGGDMREAFEAAVRITLTATANC